MQRWNCSQFFKTSVLWQPPLVPSVLTLEDTVAVFPLYPFCVTRNFIDHCAISLHLLLFRMKTLTYLSDSICETRSPLSTLSDHRSLPLLDWDTERDEILRHRSSDANSAQKFLASRANLLLTADRIFIADVFSLEVVTILAGKPFHRQIPSCIRTFPQNFLNVICFASIREVGKEKRKKTL